MKDLHIWVPVGIGSVALLSYFVLPERLNIAVSFVIMLGALVLRMVLYPRTKKPADTDKPRRTEK